MRSLPILAVVLVATLASAARADDDGKRQADFKWARGIADDFLRAVKKQDDANVETLLVADYAKLLKDRTTFNPEPAAAVYERTKSFDKWTITDEELSPDRDEAVFQGELSSTSGTRAFALRVVKDKATGRWRVGLLFVEDEKPTAKAKDTKK